jgi:hypothetical protein
MGTPYFRLTQQFFFSSSDVSATTCFDQEQEATPQ